MTMTQTTGVAIPYDGLSGTPQKDDAQFRIDHGGTSSDKSDLLVIKYLGGWLWIGTGTPVGLITAISRKDHAYNDSNGVMYRYNSSTSWLEPWKS